MATISSNIATYRLVSGTWYQSDGETYYKTTIIGRGDDASDDSTKQTTNYSVAWAHGFGTFSLPSDATILSVKCVASVNRFWNNSYTGEFTGTLYNGDTAISASERFSGYGSGQQDAFEQQTINATTLPSVADINSGNVELRCNLPSAWCGKMFGATLYIEYLGSNGIFNMTLGGGGGGWKTSVGVYTSTGSYKGQLDFDVEYEPSEYFVCITDADTHAAISRQYLYILNIDGTGTPKGLYTSVSNNVPSFSLSAPSSNVSFEYSEQVFSIKSSMILGYGIITDATYTLFYR